MKKVLALLLALTMILTFAACGKKTEDNGSETANSEKETQSQAAEQKNGSVPEGAVTDETNSVQKI